jgi:hypothetical protein
MVLGGGVLASLALAGTLAGALLTAGPASAASRGFIIRNDSNNAITVVGARALPTYVCLNFTCVPTHYRIDFSEGRPPDGAVLPPNSSRPHAWELKYGFDLVGGVQYAANVVYRINGTDATVEYQMYVYPTSNDSFCKVIGTTKFTCTASGRDLTFKNS